MKKLTFAEIKQLVIESGGHFFDKDTMKFFGETSKNYKTKYDAKTGTNYVIRTGGTMGNGTFKLIQRENGRYCMELVSKENV